MSHRAGHCIDFANGRSSHNGKMLEKERDVKKPCPLWDSPIRAIVKLRYVAGMSHIPVVTVMYIHIYNII